MKKYDIFISYRRDGGYETAKHLFDLLDRDGYSVSFDIDTLRNGDFDTAIFRIIDSCKDFILILSPGIFDRYVKNASNDDDWVRKELSYALKQKKNIIPIMLKGFDGFPPDLPEDIAPIARKNAVIYEMHYFNAFYEKLKKDFMTSRSRKTRMIPVIAAAAVAVIAALAWFAAEKGVFDKAETGKGLTETVASGTQAHDGTQTSTASSGERPANSKTGISTGKSADGRTASEDAALYNGIAANGDRRTAESSGKKPETGGITSDPTGGTANASGDIFRSKQAAANNAQTGTQADNPAGATGSNANVSGNASGKQHGTAGSGAGLHVENKTAARSSGDAKEAGNVTAYPAAASSATIPEWLFSDGPGYLCITPSGIDRIKTPANQYRETSETLAIICAAYQWAVAEGKSVSKTDSLRTGEYIGKTMTPKLYFDFTVDRRKNLPSGETAYRISIAGTSAKSSSKASYINIIRRMEFDNVESSGVLSTSNEQIQNFIIGHIEGFPFVFDTMCAYDSRGRKFLKFYLNGVEIKMPFSEAAYHDCGKFIALENGMALDMENVLSNDNLSEYGSMSRLWCSAIFDKLVFLPYGLSETHVKSDTEYDKGRDARSIITITSVEDSFLEPYRLILNGIKDGKVSLSMRLDKERKQELILISKQKY